MRNNSDQIVLNILSIEPNATTHTVQEISVRSREETGR